MKRDFVVHVDRGGEVSLEMVEGWIGRLSLRRSLKSHLLRGVKERVEVCLLSEFDGSVEGNFEELQVQLCLRDASTFGQVGSPWSSRRRDGVTNIAIFDILMPDECGSYQLLVTVAQPPPGNCLVLPLVSSVFQIVDKIPSDWTILCTSFRPLKLLNPHSRSVVDVLIQEERGRTMGSHLWDSSLVLFKNFHSLLSHRLDIILEQRSGLVAVELGAGCSLLGITIAKYLHGCQTLQYSHVHCTDLTSQVPLIRDNLLLNHLDEMEISACELDWASSRSLDAFVSRLRSQAGEGLTVGVDLIIASDVLYQTDMTEHFFRTLTGLASPHTLILLAQKVRSNSAGQTSLDTVDLRSYPLYEAKSVLQEAGVVVWELIKKES
jgi:predicted nicotinamide N-methyase